MKASFENILQALPHYREAVHQLREVLLANLIMIGEIPAPTFAEKARVKFLQQRFSECGLENASTDEADNGVGILPGTDGKNSILVVAHTDTVHDDSVDHTLTVQADSVTGPGVADNSLSLAVLATLPDLLNHLQIRLSSNLILLGSSRSLGRGDLEGLRFFLANNNLPITAAVCLEGVQLGRLSFASLGMLRGEINCVVPEEYDWTRFGASGAIVTLNEVINRLMDIPLPRRPRTSLVMGQIRGGTSFNTIAHKAVLRFEIRSESPDMVRQLRVQIQDILAEISSQTGSQVDLDILATRKTGGMKFNHPLARCSRAILEQLEVTPRISPSTSELSALIDRMIPAITLGLTTGSHLNEPGEVVQIEPVLTGLAQLIGILAAIDGGHCYDYSELA